MPNRLKKGRRPAISPSSVSRLARPLRKSDVCPGSLTADELEPGWTTTEVAATGGVAKEEPRKAKSRPIEQNKIGLGNCMRAF